MVIFLFGVFVLFVTAFGVYMGRKRWIFFLHKFDLVTSFILALSSAIAFAFLPPWLAPAFLLVAVLYHVVTALLWNAFSLAFLVIAMSRLVVSFAAPVVVVSMYFTLDFTGHITALDKLLVSLQLAIVSVLVYGIYRVCGSLVRDI